MNTKAITIQPARSTFPAPPANAVVFSNRAGANVVALAVSPAAGGVSVQASLVDGQGHGIQARKVKLRVDGLSRATSSCGDGCYSASFAATQPSSVSVTVEAPAIAWRLKLPAWPLPSARALVTHAWRVWRNLRSLSILDRLSSGGPVTLTTDWRIQAPDRIEYRIHGGGSSIIIGAKRWSKANGGTKWTETAQLPVVQPTPLWVTSEDEHVVGSMTVAGKRAVLATFYDPKTPGWFEVAIDPTTGRTLEAHMTTTAHFMEEHYFAFNSTPPITAPR